VARFRNKLTYWPKIVISIYYPTCINNGPVGMTRQNFGTLRKFNDAYV